VRFELHYEKTRGLVGTDAESFEAKYEVRDGAAIWTRTEIADVDLQRVAEALRSGMSIRENSGGTRHEQVQGRAPEGESQRKGLARCLKRLGW
jgi:hypothetical protein